MAHLPFFASTLWEMNLMSFFYDRKGESNVCPLTTALEDVVLPRTRILKPKWPVIYWQVLCMSGNKFSLKYKRALVIKKRKKEKVE